MPPPRNSLTSPISPSGAKIIALMNFKGGVGKTTVAVNLAAAMAHRLNKKVLLIDLDPQCSATLWLMTRTEWAEARAEKLTISDFFNRAAIGNTCDSKILSKVIRPVAEHEGKTLDLAPSSIDLLELEVKFNKVSNSFKPLGLALWPLREKYDYVIIDCPPSFSIVTKNALFAADHVFVPYLPDFLSLPGLQWICRLNRQFQSSIQAAKPQLKTAEIAGIIFNAFSPTVNIGKQSRAELEDSLSQMIQLQLLPDWVEIMEPALPQDTKLKEAPGYIEPITICAPDSKAAKAFASLAQNLINHISER